MTRDELADIVRQSMEATKFCKPGSVLFSGTATIKPCPFYIMGLNPGGDPKVLTGSIIEKLAPPDGTSPYTHECWNKACGNDDCVHIRRAQSACGRLADEDLVKHQKNVIRLSHLLGYDAPGEIPSANAIFARSRSLDTLTMESGFSTWDWWKACWPIHQQLLNVVRPKVIIAFGYGKRTSAFGFLAREVGVNAPSPIDETNPREGRTICARIPLRNSSLSVRVIGVPHPSWFAPGPKLSGLLQMCAHEG